MILTFGTAMGRGHHPVTTSKSVQLLRGRGRGTGVGENSSYKTAHVLLTFCRAVQNLPPSDSQATTSSYLQPYAHFRSPFGRILPLGTRTTSGVATSADTTWHGTTAGRLAAR